MAARLKNHPLVFGCTLRRVVSIAAAGALSVSGWAQRPVVKSIEPGEAPIKGAVLSVARTSDGTVFVGSNTLASFDGDRWQTIETENLNTFRSLSPTADGHRVYVGAMGSLGYLTSTIGGSWKYVSLQTQLRKALDVPIGDVWSTYATAQGATWVTDNRVIRYTEAKENVVGENPVEVIFIPSDQRLSSFRNGESIMVYQKRVGLLVVGATGSPQLAISESQLPGPDITWIIFKNGTSEIDLIGAGDSAFKRSADGNWKQLPQLSAFLAGTLPIGAEVIESTDGKDQRIVIATYKAGIFPTDRNGKLLDHYSTKNGLTDDSVNSLWAEKGKLWAALGTGLAQIENPVDASLYNRGEDIGNGTPLRVLEHEGAPYALTTKGLYRLNGGHEAAGIDAAATTPLLQSEAHLWDVQSIGHNLWAGGFGGAWRLSENGKMEREHAVSADVLLMAPVPQSPTAILMVENYALKLLVQSKYGWASRETGITVSDTPVSLVGTATDAWLATISGAVYRYAWMAPRETAPTDSGAVPTPRLALKGQFLPGAGLPAKLSDPRLTVLGNKVFAFAGETILRLSNSETGFQKEFVFENYRGIAATTGDSNISYWLTEPKNLIGLGATAIWRTSLAEDGSITKVPLDVPGLASVGSVTGIDRTMINGKEELWVTGSRGIMRVAAASLVAPSPAPQVPLYGRALDEDGAENQIGGEAKLPLPTGIKRIDFRYAAPQAAGGEMIYYQTMMQGVDKDWSAPSRLATRQFGGLAPGNYTFRVRTVDRFGRTGPENNWAFALEAPWYLQTPTFVVYGIGALLIIAAGVRWRLSRLRATNERLNRLVSERTKELELSNTAKSEFLESISHELRNPLNGMMGMIGQLEEDRMLDEDRGVLRTLKACSEQMAQAFEDVLGFSKIEYGYVKVERKPFLLRDTLNNVRTLLQPLAEQRRNTVTVSWPADLKDGFVGDAGKIKTVIGNFLGNAIKYAPGKPITISVETHVIEPTKTSKGMVNLMIEVTDQGPGIAADEQELIFKKFVRGAGSKDVAGTGLGLATCNVLAKLMNGSVGLDSTVGKGSTFYLRVLVGKTTTLPKPENAMVAAPQKGLRALVVEDETYNQAVLQGIALRLGFGADVAIDASAANALLTNNGYDVVFLDWELPGAKGDDVAKQIRAKPGEQPIILAITAHDSDEIREKCLAAGMDGFLLKPYNAAKVRDALNEAAVKRGTSPWGTMTEGAPLPTGSLDLEAFDNYSRAKLSEGGSASALYCKAVDEEVTALQAAMREENNEGIAKCAHRLRALGGLIGAVELNQAATKLEALARSGTDEERARQTELIVAASEELRQKLA